MVGIWGMFIPYCLWWVFLFDASAVLLWVCVWGADEPAEKQCTTFLVLERRGVVRAWVWVLFC
jgi:hypothetical protein